MQDPSPKYRCRTMHPKQLKHRIESWNSEATPRPGQIGTTTQASNAWGPRHIHRRTPLLGHHLKVHRGLATPATGLSKDLGLLRRRKCHSAIEPLQKPHLCCAAIGITTTSHVQTQSLQRHGPPHLPRSDWDIGPDHHPGSTPTNGNTNTAANLAESQEATPPRREQRYWRRRRSSKNGQGFHPGKPHATGMRLHNSAPNREKRRLRAPPPSQPARAPANGFRPECSPSLLHEHD